MNENISDKPNVSSEKNLYRHQLRTEVEKAGLVVEEEFSSYDKSPPGAGEIILVCRKK